MHSDPERSQSKCRARRAGVRLRGAGGGCGDRGEVETGVTPVGLAAPATSGSPTANPGPQRGGRPASDLGRAPPFIVPLGGALSGRTGPASCPS